LLNMSLTLNLIAWTTTVILIVGIPTYQLTSNILATVAEQDSVRKKCDLLDGMDLRPGLANILN